MPTVTYDTSIGDGVAAGSAAGFGREVDRVLADPRGWAKYGYRFVRDAQRPALRIRLETSAAAAALCGAEGFSCWRRRPNDIVMHEGNWNGGCQSRLPLERYRNYVVCHEVGHALGLPHQRCPAAECARRGMKTCPASVMQQMTCGPGAIAPCAEADWPLDPDWGIDDPRRGRSASGVPLPYLILATAIVLVLVLVVAVAVAVAAARRISTRGKPGAARPEPEAPNSGLAAPVPP